MNRTLSTIVAAIIMASFASPLFATDATKLNERNMKAKALSGTPNSAVNPATPTAKSVSPETSAVVVKPSPAADATAKKRAAAKLRERNKKARVLSDTSMKADAPATQAAPAAK